MDFEITNRHNLKIVGIFDRGYSDKLVFVMHGLSGTTEDLHIKVIRKSFLDAGFSVVAFDCTHSYGKSEGKYETATLTGYLEDLEDVIAWSKKQVWFHAPFSLAGQSMGGYTVTRFAELYPTDCEMLVAYAPVVSGEKLQQNRRHANPENYKNWKETGYMEEKSNSRPGLMKRLLWNPHVTDSFHHNLLPDASKITVPVLIIVGENDQPCPVEDQKELVTALGSKDKELVIIPGASHTFTSHADLDMLQTTISSWLTKHKTGDI